MGYTYLAEAYLEKRDFAAAVAAIENASVPLNDPISLSAAAFTYARAGDRDKALRILRNLESQSSPAVHIAQVYVGLGDHERAFAWIEKACGDRSVWLIWLGVDPAFNPLRADHRFKDLLKRINQPKQNL